MKKIKLNLNALLKTLIEMERDHMNEVELQIVPSQYDCGERQPAFLHLEGIRAGERKDYESVDEILKVEELKSA
ncbi:hypothetical protein [Caproiciproducens sp. LBM24188]|nr:hypothetical protein [Oscillospiraceae bacterium]HHV31127.1 hypothetical protein [Clostridiales bacterium]